MNPSYYIEIKGLNNPVDFVNQWSGHYKFSNEWKYDNHITTVLDDETSFIQLFKWKNGTGDTIYWKKMKGINEWKDRIGLLRTLKQDFRWDVFETEFKPTQSSTIWKIFLLHLINPDEFPIFDQHVFRCYNFFQKGVIEEISTKRWEVYSIYKNEYKPWFNSLRKDYNLNPKRMDMSFFTFGQVLKRLRGLPIQIKE